MSFYVAGSMFAAGTYSAVNKRKGAMANANERRRAARESLITAGFNIRERTKEGQQTQFGVLEQGGAVSQKIAIAGKEAEGSAKASMGGKGALVETGSNRATLTSIAQTAVAEQTNVIIQTKNQIKAIARDTSNANKSEWRNAKLNQEQQNRIASREKSAANKQFTSDMAETAISAYMGGSSMAGTGNVAKWGKTASTAKQVGTGAHVAQGAVLIKSRPGRPMPKGVNSNIANKSKYSYGSHKSNRTFYPKGESPQSGKMPGGWVSGLKKQIGRDRQGPRKNGFSTNLINFLKGTGWKGRASRKKFKY